MSRKRKIWVVVSLAVALVVLIPLGLRWRAQWHLNAYRKKLIASGEKLTVEELAPKRIPNATNTTLFLKLASALPSFSDFSPTVMMPIKPGVARVAWRQTRCLEKMDEKKPAIDVWPGLMEAMRTNQAGLGQMQELVDANGIEFIQDYSQLDPNGFAYLPLVKRMVSDFRASAVLALHQGRRSDAYLYFKSCGAACQLISKNPLMIDQLVRYSCLAIASSGCWEALQAGDWTEAQLADLQHEWDGSAILAGAEASIAMERARAPMMFQEMRTSPQDNAEIWNDFLVNTRTGVSELFTAYPRYWGWRWIWSYKEEQRYLELMQTMIEVTRATQKRRSVLGLLKDRNPDSTIPLDASASDLFRQEVSTTETFVAQALRAQTVANMVTAAIALERFRLSHHAYPEALANLVPEFLQSVPVDCMDGRDLRYRLNPDGTYLLYSVGDDGIDDGGDARPKEGASASFWYYGRDLVWPRAATDEEVQAYEAEQNKPKVRGKR